MKGGKSLIKTIKIDKLKSWKKNLQVDIMLHQSHASITWPTLLVVIPNNIFIVWIRVLSQVPLNQIPGIIS